MLALLIKEITPFGKIKIKARSRPTLFSYSIAANFSV
jgi:hypothetical protein